MTDECLTERQAARPKDNSAVYNTETVASVCRVESAEINSGSSQDGQVLKYLYQS